MAKVKNVTIPAPQPIIDALDRLVADGNEAGEYPPPTRSSVIRRLIDEADRKAKRARKPAVVEYGAPAPESWMPPHPEFG